MWPAFSDGTAESVPLGIAYILRQKIERVLTWFDKTIDVSEKTLEGTLADGLASTETDVYAEFVEIGTRLYFPAKPLVDGLCQMLIQLSISVVKI